MKYILSGDTRGKALKFSSKKALKEHLLDNFTQELTVFDPRQGEYVPCNMVRVLAYASFGGVHFRNRWGDNFTIEKRH